MTTVDDEYGRRLASIGVPADVIAESRRIREEQAKITALLAPHMDEIEAGAVLAHDLQTTLLDRDLEWIAPASYGWGKPGETGGVLYGLPLRIVDGIDRLYLAHKVKP